MRNCSCKNQMRAAPPLRCNWQEGVGCLLVEKAETATRCGFQEASSRGRIGTMPGNEFPARHGSLELPSARTEARRKAAIRTLGTIVDKFLATASWTKISTLSSHFRQEQKNGDKIRILSPVMRASGPMDIGPVRHRLDFQKQIKPGQPTLSAAGEQHTS